MTATTFKLGDRSVRRMGYGAMQLAGPGVFGPPKDHAAALAVLREAVASGVNHIVTKVGGRRGEDASWQPAQSPAELVSAVHDNLRNLGVEAIDVVNLRLMGGHAPTEGAIEPQFSTLVELQKQGLIRHLGLSNATSGQVDQALGIGDIVCVQNHYNLAHRGDDALVDRLAAKGIAYVPFFPLGGFFPLQVQALSDVAQRLGHTPLQVALAWLLHRAPNILLIPGTSSLAHLRENLAAADITLSGDVLSELDAIGAKAPVH